MATKKSAKKTAKKEVNMASSKKEAKKAAKKSSKKSVMAENTAISSEVDARLEEQKKELEPQTMTVPVASQKEGQSAPAYSEEQKGSKNIILITVIVIILILVGFLIFERSKSQQADKTEPAKIESPQTPQTQRETPAQQQQVQQNVETAPVNQQNQTATPAPKTKEYEIQRGDTLTRIANKLNVKQEQLRELNPDVDWTKLKVGQKIKVPAN